MELSRTQKVTKFFSSATKFEAMKQESMLWVITCSSCKESTSIWDLGGIRYKAKGNPKIGVKCPKCGVKGMSPLTKAEAE